MHLLCSQIKNLIETERDLLRSYEDVGKIQYKFLGGTDRHQWDAAGMKMHDYDMESLIELYKNTSRNITILNIYDNQVCPYFRMRVETTKK